MSSSCRCAAAIIAKSIALAMKPRGGRRPVSIPVSVLAALAGDACAADDSGQNGHRRRDLPGTVGTEQRTAKRDRQIGKRG